MIESDERVDLRNRLLQIASVLLHHATGDDQPFDALVLALGNFEDRVDRLLFRSVDEAAGVDDHDIGLVEIVRDRDVRLLAELSQHDLGIDEILGASEGDHPDTSGHGSAGKHR